MVKVYVDAGFYAGVALEQYVRAGIVDDSWEIHVFECNPELDTKTQVERFDLPITWHTQAVWVENGTVPFLVSARPNASSVKGTAGNPPENEIQVACIDFSEFIDRFEKVNILNMDIEGSEYAVLQKLLDTDVISKVGLLDIEFHDRLMQDETPDDSARLIRDIGNKGVKICLKPL